VRRSADCIVVGLGAMGAAAARALSRRGLRVLGFDRFAPPHALGSSHGDSRIIREAYFEHPAYVPLVQRAYLLWEELERESGRPLLARTGGVMIGPRGGALVKGALASAEAHRLPHELLDAAAIAARVPAFRPDADWVGVWEPNDGVLRPEAGIAAMLAAAARHGAALRTDEPALAWRAERTGVSVTTARGRYRAGTLVLAAGAWMPRLAPELPLTVARQLLFWFEPVGARAAHDPGLCPISIWEYAPERFFYSFPRSEQGVKVAIHGRGAPADPDRLDREVRADEVAEVRALVQRWMPFASGPLTASVACMYTNTPDGHFVIDRHPAHANVMLVSACSGHGFKFAPVVGEAVSDLVVEGRTRHDLSRFGARRWSGGPGAGAPKIPGRGA
jgi:sarcosine oxidase